MKKNKTKKLIDAIFYRTTEKLVILKQELMFDGMYKCLIIRK